MITLTAKIDFTEASSTLKVGGIGTEEFAYNNVSSHFGYVVNKLRKQTQTPFIIGSSKIGDGSVFVDKPVDYFIGSKLSNENGMFTNLYQNSNGTYIDFYQFDISKDDGSNIGTFTIAFDVINNRHPRTIIVNSTTYTLDDPTFTINIEKPMANIIIRNWNTPNSPLVFTGIYAPQTEDLLYTNLISCKSTIFDRSDYNLPNYGIISNPASIEFNDPMGKIKDYADQLVLVSGLKVTISLTDTLENSSETIAEMQTKEWDYDNNNKIASVSLQDDLVEWQDIYIEGFSYDPRNPFSVLPNGSMEDLYKWLWDRTPSKYNMLTFDELDENTKTILTSTTVQYPLLESAKLWEQWTKLCQVCALYIYKNRNGRTVCSYTYGS